MSELKFAHIEYSIQTKSLDIFTIGCNGSCEGCCNPQLKDWEQPGKHADYIIMQAFKLYSMFPRLIDRILLVGGDPADAYRKYPKDMLNFLHLLKKKVPRPIYLFTRHGQDAIPTDLLDAIDYLKVGAYIPSLKVNDNIQYGIKLATSNQHIIKLH